MSARTNAVQHVIKAPTAVSHDADTPTTPRQSPANRLGLDYRAVPPRRLVTRLLDFHTHLNNAATLDQFIAAADLYGIGRIVTMTPLEQVEALRSTYGDRLAFIAIPRWRDMANVDAFRARWLADLGAFREKGARWMKFWMAPPMRGEHGLSLRDPFFAPLIQRGLELGYDFMIHVGDPHEWFQPGGKYADAAKFGAKHEHYPQLEYLLDAVAPRRVLAAHMGGNPEEPEFLQDLLDRHANLYLDSSATKWVVRAIARQPAAMRAFMIRNADRVLFGSDLVVADQYDFEHYASRYWVHQMLWETPCAGESPIEDPDAPDPPRLTGLDLPVDVLQKLYADNAIRLGF
ncbi:MAG: amidohydrolase family protein [Planctomycetota bacterium]